MVHETEKVLNLFDEFRDWDVVSKLVIEGNYLQKGTLSTRKREFAELKKRLSAVNDDWIDFSKNATSDEMRLFVLFLCAKSYRLIFEFLSEIVRVKILTFDYKISNSDYERFIESKRANSEKLQKCTDLTLAKIKQVIFKILEQTKLIDDIKTKNIQKPYVSQELICVVNKTNPNYLVALMFSDTDISNFKKSLK